jgi:hypothetical protein
MVTIDLVHYFAKNFSFGTLLACNPCMNTQRNSSRRTNHTAQPAPRTAGVIPVTQLCEIACLVLCRVVVPKLARGFQIAG